MTDVSKVSTQTKNKQRFEKEMLVWMEEFVEKPHQLLGNWPPCPFARKARLGQNIEMHYCNESSFFDMVRRIAFLYEGYPEIVIIGTKPNSLQKEDVRIFAKNLRKELKGSDVWPLFDHPMDIENVNNVVMNQGHYLFCILQSKKKLTDARKELRSKGYYDLWPLEQVNRMIDVNE